MNFHNSEKAKKNYYFNEVTSITGVKPYVLRFWESEFSQISPVTSEQGVKHYSQEDIESIKEIKNLLFNEKLSIPQAKLRLSSRDEVEISDKAEDLIERAEDNKIDYSQVEIKLHQLLDRIDNCISQHHW